MEHKLNEAMAHGSLYENAAKSIAPEIFGHQDVPRKAKKPWARMQIVSNHSYSYRCDSPFISIYSFIYIYIIIMGKNGIYIYIICVWFIVVILRLLKVGNIQVIMVVSVQSHGPMTWILWGYPFCRKCAGSFFRFSLGFNWSNHL